MKTKLITTIMTTLFLTFAVVALPLVSVPAVSATTLKFDEVISIDDWGVPGPLHPETTMYWKGTISGAITGTCYFWEHWEENYVVGKVEHFFEDFYIDLGDGEWISGHDKGVWNFATFKYRATGRVTDASSEYAYLIGCKFFEEGTTTNPANGFPIIGIGTGFIKS